MSRDPVLQPTNLFTGNGGDSWFDPGSWSTGAIPKPGETVGFFSGAAAIANAGTVSGVTIDISAGSPSSGPPQLVLFADQLGTETAPVAIVATADGGAPDNALVDVGTLHGSIAVDASSTLTWQGGTISGNVTINQGSTLASAIFGVVRSATSVVFDGHVLVDGGTLSIDGSESGSGAIEIANKGVFAVTTLPFAPPGQVDDLPVSFDPSGGTLDLSDTLLPGYGGTISGFGPGDTILARADGVGDTDGSLATSFSGGVLTVTDAQGQEQTYRFAGDLTAANLVVSASSSSTYTIAWQPCFAAGTLIATAAGDRAVETLSVGDRLRLHDGSIAAIVWLGHRRQIGGHVVRICAGALGAETPRGDLIVSEDHGIFADGVLVPAHLLVNDDTIVRERRDTIAFHHVELERHAILLAEGAPAESYLDTGNRAQFANCALAYDPVRAVRGEHCAELVFAGTRLETIRTKLARAAVE